MYFNSSNNYIQCSFSNGENDVPDRNAVYVEVYYANTEEILSEYQLLGKHITNDEKLRADKFHFKEDRETWLFCHVLLRFVLAEKLTVDPSEIKIIIDKNNKPWLAENRLFFNISHTREAFTFIISERGGIGVDMEKIDRNIDFRSIIETFFSVGEINFILEDPDKSRDRFFLLWTRKEALLKAIGTGLVDNLQDVEVFRNINFLKPVTFSSVKDDSLLCDHYIYSGKINDNFLSIALSERSDIVFQNMDLRYIEYLLRTCDDISYG